MVWSDAGAIWRVALFLRSTGRDVETICVERGKMPFCDVLASAVFVHLGSPVILSHGNTLDGGRDDLALPRFQLRFVLRSDWSERLPQAHVFDRAM